MNQKNYLKNNLNIYVLVGIVLSSVLIFNISIFFSSVRSYLINNVKKEIGDYHVIIKGKVKDDRVILKKRIKSDRVYITFKNIYRVYINTKKICEKSNCETITYNDKLLSLYGMSKNENIMKTMKELLIFILISLSIILFFIIYNSFKVKIIKQRKEICLFKLSGCTNWDIFILYLKETSLLFIIGLFIGFIISLITNQIFIMIINNLLNEVFDNLKLSVNPSFTLLSIIFIFITVFSSSLLPLKIIKKYKPLELFRKNEIYNIQDIKIDDNIPLWLAKINYIRQNKKYRSLIVSIFISCLSINVFSLFLNYGLRCIKEYIIIPNYDLAIVSDNYNLNEIVKDLKPSKKVSYKSCTKEIELPKKNYNHHEKDILITDLGNNELINIKESIVEKNGKLKKEKYQIFKELNNITIENEKINIILTDKNRYNLPSDKIILNLEKEKFEKVCENKTNNLYLKTNYQGIDKYMNNLIKKKKLNIDYINVKKEREILNNIIIIIKLLLYIITILIIIITISVVINITSASIEFRKKEISILKSIGLEKKRIIYSLFIESLIVSFKGWLYSLPFIFIINKYMIISINEVFYNQKIIYNINIIISLLLFITIVFTSMNINVRKIDKDLIDSIKER